MTIISRQHHSYTTVIALLSMISQYHNTTTSTGLALDNPITKHHAIVLLYVLWRDHQPRKIWSTLFKVLTDNINLYQLRLHHNNNNNNSGHNSGGGGERSLQHVVVAVAAVVVEICRAKPGTLCWRGMCLTFFFSPTLFSIYRLNSLFIVFGCTFLRTTSTTNESEGHSCSNLVLTPDCRSLLCLPLTTAMLRSLDSVWR